MIPPKDRGLMTAHLSGRYGATSIKDFMFGGFFSSKRIGSMWLAKNVGLVKWEVKEEKVPFRYLLPVK